MNQANALEALKKYFGYDEFRPNQAEIIQNIYDGGDTLVLMPTGGGKSICYQIPAVTMPGTCVVVSPLISLMKDQVEALKVNGITCAFINSSQTKAEQQNIEDDLYYNRLQLVYVSPEKLVSQSFLPLLKRIKINLFAIDEAHCISSWGHDFRPEYTQLQFLKNQFPEVPIVALTATADKLTRQDIITQLGLENPEQFLASFDRPNLSLSVRPGQKRLQQIIDFIKERPGQPGIVYCLSRKNTEEVSSKLNALGLKADYYHAGMSSSNRSSVQEAFLNDTITIVCATVAFGMGIDKSNVRWVIHYNLPKNIEGFYQEIGRAGRDGAKADTLLFYSYRDVMVMRDILTQNESDLTEVKLAKLERMQQYAESLTCRRRILLSYFGEAFPEDCGNCDICSHPPTYVEGKVIAQKALSAIYRLKGKVGINTLVDVLRGSGKKEILNKGYQHIKTYGAGRDISTGAWKYYITQLINNGLIEIAYDEHNALKPTPVSKEILFDNKGIQLVQFQSAKAYQEKQAKAVKVKSRKQQLEEELFEVLRKLRRDIAQKKGLPPYIIFADATLNEMVDEKPVTAEAFRNISGVGEQKMKQYGKEFMAAIRSFIRDKGKEGVRITGSTYVETLQLVKEGLTIEEISEKRSLSPNTVASHIAHLYENEEDISINQFVTESTVKLIEHILPGQERPYKLKPIYEQLNEEVSYNEIRLALASLKRDGKI